MELNSLMSNPVKVSEESHFEGKDFFIHPQALVETGEVGPKTRIWAFAHVLKGASIGANCNIGDHCFIEGKVAIGNEVVVKNGVSIWDGVTIEDRVFIGPNVSFTNDFIPRAKVYHERYEKTLVQKGASIGSNATILCGITLGKWCVVGAGSVVTKDVPAFGLVYGNPARLRGWVCRCGKKLDFGGGVEVRCACGDGYFREGERVRRKEG